MKFNQEKDRIFAEDETGKLIAEVTFSQRADGAVDINHTFVDDSLRGQGIADQLMREVHESLKKEDRKAILTCPYAVKWFRNHPEKEDVLAR